MRNQRGNILFLILLAVILFAALSYAVTSSMRGGGKDASEENVKLAATAITQYFSLVQTEVMRLRAKGCEIDNLDWRNGYWKRIDGSPSVGILHNPQIAKAGCAVFSDYGGPVPSNVDFSKYGDKTYDGTAPTYKVKSGHLTTGWMNKKGEGSDLNDIGMMVHGLPNAVCRYLLDPATNPATYIEQYSYAPDPNLASPATYTANTAVIDEPTSMAGMFFADFNTLNTAVGCYIGAVIVAR